MNAKARAKFINSVAGTDEIDDNSNKNSSSEISQGETNETTAIKNDDIEEEIFAQGLPDWDLEPPQAVVRRVRKK